MKKSHLGVILGLALILLLVGYIVFRITKQEKVVVADKETHFSNFATTTAEFTTVTGESFTPEFTKSEKLTLVVSWASWSPYTPDEFSTISRLREIYSEDELDIVTLNRKESPEQIARFIKSYPLPDNVHSIVDVNDTYYKAISGFSMPESILYGKNGEVLFHTRTKLQSESLIALIDKNLLPAVEN